MQLVQFLIRMMKNYAMRRRIAKVVRRGVKIGEGTLIYNVFFDAQFPYLISIGKESILTNGCVILAHDASTVSVLKKTKVGQVCVGDNVFLGINTIVLPGVTIGSGAVVGAGSVVTRDVPQGMVAAGNPARVLMSVEEYLSRQVDGERTFLIGPWDLHVTFEDEVNLQSRMRDKARERGWL